MQQRVAIARGLAYRPEILLMDEPFASVDAQTRADLEDLVLKIRHDYGITILFVTHDIDESVYLADRVVILSQRPTVVQETLDGAAAAPARPGGDQGAARVRAAARARLPRDQAAGRTPPARQPAYEHLLRAARGDRLGRAVAGRAAGRGGARRAPRRAAAARCAKRSCASAHDGLVVRERNRGARVRRFTLQEAVEILEARAALESLAAGYAALRRTDDEARELEALVERDASGCTPTDELLAACRSATR